jgi:uncharacterized protein YbjT (DUF2867 family)
MVAATHTATRTRVALVAGATGLVGRSLLPLLEASEQYSHVHVLVRRAVPGIESNPKVLFHTVDFAHLPTPFPRADDVYIALGTTIKVAGSQEAFRHVDHDFVVNTARAARAAGARRLAIVSALGADPTSRVFYNRVKGEMQAAVATLGYESVVIAQPSLLGLVPRGVRPIEAGAVAAALLEATLAGPPGVRILSSAKMQTLAALRA